MTEVEMREDSNEQFDITNLAEADTRHSELRRNGNHILPSIFTKLSLDTKQKSRSAMYRYDSDTYKSDILVKKNRLQGNMTSKGKPTNKPFEQGNDCCGVTKDQIKVQKYCTKEDKNLLVSHRRKNISHTITQRDVDYSHGIQREYVKTSATKNKRQKMHENTGGVQNKKKENRVSTISEQLVSKLNKEESSGESTHNIGVNDTFSKKTSKFVDQQPRRKYCAEQSTNHTLITSDTSRNVQRDNSCSDKMSLNGNKDVLDKKTSHHNGNTESEKLDQSRQSSPAHLNNIHKKQLSEILNKPSQCNVDDKEGVSETKPVPVTIKSLTETISSVTSSLLSSTEFSLLMKSPSLVLSSESASSVSSTSPHASKPSSPPTPCLPSSSQSDLSSISHSLSPEKGPKLKAEEDLKNNGNFLWNDKLFVIKF